MLLAEGTNALPKGTLASSLARQTRSDYKVLLLSLLLVPYWQSQQVVRKIQPYSLVLQSDINWPKALSSELNVGSVHLCTANASLELAYLNKTKTFYRYKCNKVMKGRLLPRSSQRLRFMIISFRSLNQAFMRSVITGRSPSIPESGRLQYH